MRTRSAKKLAQRIDLYYFKHASPLRRWRTVLSIAAPIVGLLWLGGMAAAGSRAAFSSGPVAGAHAFAESKCEVCHVRDTTFRSHVSDNACLTCHDAPAHPGSREPAPACTTCHREHQGRAALARTSDDFCVRCHGNLRRDPGSGIRDPKALPIAGNVKAFPAGHPEFRTAQPAAQDPRTLKFNHQVHVKKDLRGPKGPETLACSRCHAPETTQGMTRRRSLGGRMSALNYEDQCARCHPLFFDERLDVQAPHKQVSDVFPFIERSLREYIAAHPSDISKPDPTPRRLPLNFALPPSPPARTADEWVTARLKRADMVLSRAVCGSCHLPAVVVAGPIRGREGRPPTFQVSKVGAAPVWMPRAAFDHGPHLMVDCTSCHDAEKSTLTSDVIMPNKETCATCHAPGKGAESRCFECHAYHDWSREHPVTPRFKAGDFQ